MFDTLEEAMEGKDGHTDSAEAAHRKVADTYLDTDCRVTEWNEYPYECVRKDREPDANVAICESHGAWWVVRLVGA